MRFLFLITGILVVAHGLVQGQIVINEIHYDPEPKHELVEFIELYHAGTETVDLEGWHFDAGIRYTFPAGATMEPGNFLVLAENTAAYNRKFGSIFVGGARAFDQWESGNLSNRGETLALKDAAGMTIDEVDYRVGFPWSVAPNDETGLSMELMHPLLDNQLGSSWRPALSAPTPGNPNSVFSEDAPPNIRQVAHAPREPQAGEDVTITAKITDPDGMGGVMLLYQIVEPGRYIRLTDAAYETAWESLPMEPMGDDPSRYQARLPGEQQRHRHLTRYRIAYSDTDGNQAQAPFADDPTPNFAFFTYNGVPAWTGAAVPGETTPKVFGEDLLTSLPIYHLLSQEEDVLACQYNAAHNNKVYRFLGTLVVDGEVYDHMRYRIRGHGSTYNTGKNKWKWRFNRGRLFQGRDNFGNPYPEPVRTLNLSALATAWNPANRGICGLDEALAFKLWQMAGVPASHTNYFHFRVIDDAVEADPNNQFEGDLWGPYLAIEQFDGRALRARDLPDGNVYNMHFADSNYLNEGRGQVTDRSDLQAFTSAQTGYNKGGEGQPIAWWQENVNLEGYYSYRAVWEAVNHSDQRDQENSIYYHNPETGQWSIHPWDVDLLYEEFDRWGPDAVQTTVPFEQFRKCLQHEELEIAFQNRARELQDLLLNDDQLWHLIDEFAEMVGVQSGGGEAIAITQLEREQVNVLATTATPHGYTVGQTVYIMGAQPATYSGAKEVLAVRSSTQFLYKGSLFAPSPETPESNVSVTDAPPGGGWWEIDQARWDRHPRSRAVEGPSTNTGSFYINPFRYTRFPGKVRELVSADFPGMVDWVKRFTVPGGFGGDQLQVLADAGAKVPETPSVIYTGPEGYPIDGLRFETSAIAGGNLFVSQTFAAMQWRLGEIRNPSTPGYTPDEPMLFEIDPVWESGEVATFVPTIHVPLEAVRPERTYRLRVRLRNELGYWSHWSAPIEFQAKADVAPFADLILTEIMYHPAPVSADEANAGFEEADFEFLELWNAGDTIIDLQPLRFTKGIDFDFNTLVETMLAPGERWIIARQEDAFEMRYGFAPSASWGEDRLSNGGERLKLSIGSGFPVIDLTYGDTSPWPEAADGLGYSLEWRGHEWQASSVLGGSPGKATVTTGSADQINWVDVDITESMIVLKWESLPNEIYQLQWSRDLWTWADLGVPVPSMGVLTTHMVASLTLPKEGAYLRVAREAP